MTTYEKKPIKMIGLDMDGTVLTTKKELRPYTIDIIKRAIAQNVTVLVATGRPITGIPKEFSEIPGVRYALTANGARIFDTEQHKILYEHLLPLEQACRILDIFDKYDTLQEIYFDGQGYAEREKLERVEDYLLDSNMAAYIRNTRKPVDNLRDFIGEKKQDMDKTQALFADLNDREKALAQIRETENLTVACSQATNIEINSPGINKGIGLLKLGEYLGIKREEIMACGDGENDIEMLREVGFGVAVKNAESGVKAVADYITGSNDDEGVAKAIEKFVLL
ncbi:MAG: HAD family hydrolase [Hespellia sp.]|nr:HAD family hydrolase [Hespellia sp.]